ncbi:MAG: LTA synthase family protein [Rubripirellula sp.]
MSRPNPSSDSEEPVIEVATTETPRFIMSLAAQIENLRSWFVLMILMSIGRLCWVLANQHELTDANALDHWWLFFVTGLRFDAISSTYFLLPCFLLASLIVLAPGLYPLVPKSRKILLTVFFFVFPGLFVANIAYYHIYGNVFDEFVFEFIEGNAGDVIDIAIIDHGLIPKALICFVLGVVLTWTYLKLVDKPVNLSCRSRAVFSHWRTQVICTFVILSFLGICIRGRLGTRPLQRTDCGVTSFRVLNLGTLNPIYNLKTAWRIRSTSSRYFDDRRLIPDHQLERFVREISTLSSPSAKLTNQQEVDLTGFQAKVYQRVASGRPGVKPKHVFLLFLESYDAWPFMDEYATLGLVEEGKQLGREGQILRTFLPGANSSVRSSLVCLQGLFQSCRSRQECLPTSLVYQFKQLGYRTRSVNSFTSEWGDAEKIAREQGFEDIYCTAEIKPGGDTNNLQLHDRTLYEFAATKLNYDVPTFNFIRSSSYHGPYEVDIESEGCVIPPFPDSVRKPGMMDEDGLRLAYGHLKYSDKMMGGFVRQMIKRYPNSLFVITGDHYGRRFLTKTIPVYEGSAVPLILYGPSVLGDSQIPETMAGSHLDIPETLMELCAPEGFRYASMGKSLLSQCDNPVGIGENHVIFPDNIVSLREPARCVALPWKRESVELDEKSSAAMIDRAKKLYDAYYGVGYMMSRRSIERGSTRIATADSDRTK